jgi:hypothetical protein
MGTICFKVVLKSGHSFFKHFSDNVTLAQFDAFVSYLPFDASFELVNYRP